MRHPWLLPDFRQPVVADSLTTASPTRAVCLHNTFGAEGFSAGCIRWAQKRQMVRILVHSRARSDAVGLRAYESNVETGTLCSAARGAAGAATRPVRAPL